jgi:membrane-bound ClpP family serine protease
MKDKNLDRLSGIIAVIIFLLGTKTIQWLGLIIGIILVIIPTYTHAYHKLAIIGAILFVIGLLSPYFRKKTENAEANYDAYLRKEEWQNKIK